MEDSLSIRAYNPEDYISLQNLWDLTEMGGAERGDDQEIIKNTIKLGGSLLVMLDPSGKVIGSSWMSVDGRRMFLHHFAIHPDYQGKGLSKKLLKKSLAYCREVGLQVKLEVHMNNTRAINLYEKYGFKDLDGYKVLIMRDISK